MSSIPSLCMWSPGSALYIHGALPAGISVPRAGPPITLLLPPASQILFGSSLPPPVTRLGVLAAGTKARRVVGMRPACEGGGSEEEQTAVPIIHSWHLGSFGSLPIRSRR